MYHYISITELQLSLSEIYILIAFNTYLVFNSLTSGFKIEIYWYKTIKIIIYDNIFILDNG